MGELVFATPERDEIIFEIILRVRFLRELKEGGSAQRWRRLYLCMTASK